MLRHAIAAAAALAWAAGAAAQTGGPPLVVEAKVPLGNISGRIDHLGVDVERRRLFVAELGNDSLGVVDLAAGRMLRTIAGFSEPQGVAYVPIADSVYIANGGDGSVRMLRGEELAPAGQIELGSDADNVRIDTQRHRVLVGYGKGALAVIDPATRTKSAEIRLKAHPESFQIDDSGAQVFVNVPNAGGIEVADLDTKAVRFLPAPGLRANFPMAIDHRAHQVLVVFRSPPTLLALSAEDRRFLARLDTCGDADDVFADEKRARVYISCGDGVVDVLERREAGFTRLGRVATVSGARTSLFVPELDRLYVAVRARTGEPAAIWILRPLP